MELHAVQRIGVVGGGVMGGGIAQVLALAGYRVTIRDLTQQILDETRAEIVDRKWSLKRSVERGKLGFDLAVAAIERIGYTLSLEELRDCDLVIEAVPEKTRTETARVRRTRFDHQTRSDTRVEHVRLSRSQTSSGRCRRSVRRCASACTSRIRCR